MSVKAIPQQEFVFRMDYYMYGDTSGYPLDLGSGGGGSGNPYALQIITGENKVLQAFFNSQANGGIASPGQFGQLFYAVVGAQKQHIAEEMYYDALYGGRENWPVELLKEYGFYPPTRKETTTSALSLFVGIGLALVAIAKFKGVF